MVAGNLGPFLAVSRIGLPVAANLLRRLKTKHSDGMDINRRRADDFFSG